MRTSDVSPEHVQVLLLKAVKDLLRELRRMRRRDAEIFDDEEE